MGCHSQIWTNAAMLEPVRASFRSGDDPPDFVYFYKVNTLYMQWCIECHRNPEKYVRPRDQVFNMAYDAPPDQPALGRRLVAEYRIQSLTDCVTCHR